MSIFNNIKNKESYLGLCKLDAEEKKIVYKNPHCGEFFCTFNNILNCSQCLQYLKNVKKINLNTKFIKKINQQSDNFCKQHCMNGFIYDFIAENWDVFKNKESKMDKYKIIKNFYQSELIYKYDQIPYEFNEEPTLPKPKTVVHWGQLKMFLVTLLFLVKKINPTEKEIHIIYAGSARGDNILILCDMFPNTIWYLIDPAPFHDKLKSHKQVKEIINDFFTDDTAKYYAEKFKNIKHPLLLLSDIRVSPDDKSVLENQEWNINWHNIIKPDYSYFKFRCPYEGYEIYNYYDGEIYIQPYARVSSSETRILLETKLSKKNYNVAEYLGRFSYFNRILRPSYYKKQIIPDSEYFDHCYDCTHFSYLIQNYLNKFKTFNPFKTNDVYEIMKNITNYIIRLTKDKIKQQNDYVHKNII
jgi:hypothetical protein